MLSIGLWRWNINITITILGNIRRPVLLKTEPNSTGLSIPRKKHIRLRYEPNRLMLSIGLWQCYINITMTILDIIHRPVFYLKLSWTHLNSIGLSVPHRKHITFPLRAQQVNAIYRFVMVRLSFESRSFGDFIPSSLLGWTYSVGPNR
jgi:hypothetical protein